MDVLMTCLNGLCGRPCALAAAIGLSGCQVVALVGDGFSTAGFD